MRFRDVMADARRTFWQDAARWVVPESVVSIDTVSTTKVLRLLYQNPSLRAMAWFRLANALRSVGVRGTSSWTQRRLLRLYGLELSIGLQIGGGLYIAHPVGCVLHATSIGSNVTVISAVTFGTLEAGVWPTIGDDTFFGAGARVLGAITIGSGAKVGANAVVLHDVPARATAVGVPARVLERRVGEPEVATPRMEPSG